MTHKLALWLSGAVCLVASTTAIVIPMQDAAGDALAPLHMPAEAEAIADSYIVILKDHVDSKQALDHHCSWVSDAMMAAGGRRDDDDDLLLDSAVMSGIQHTYNSATWRGYSGRFSPQVLEHIRRSPDVAYVEHDSMVYTSELQRNAPWGLARISHRNALSLSTFNKYPYEGDGGSDVKVYVIDTGINTAHHDFEGRAEWGVTIPEGEADEDGNGHGSHCAGTIAGKRFGVAKKARPVAVKVLRSNGSGSMSGVLAGVSWAAEQHQMDAQRDGHKYKGAVANMSLGGGRSNALNRAVNEAVNSGIVFAVAAGNDNRNACQYSPAGAENAITVGASNIRDERAYFSNHGPCVDVFAPGENILSVWNGGKDSTNTISGTSMASPHVAGLAAYFVSMADSFPVVPKDIKAKIIDLATPDKLSKLPKDTRNLLIYNGGDEKEGL